ncbi:hypothetical protein PAXRUDRAFT_397247 [Paxillus rubicundulus Ve08.2h10]|uniref:Cytoplasmic protein n=1 Tax=Paxillus rubicundulus Ve08.2h10 TaxID=930991 RepID=A0A0D0CPA0_9AGAM|nr:hypothetical protein PAXRUDRAFT_397247 [Paxillus rubicundulus Ve08.2h10]
MSREISDVLTNEALPKTEATITIRVIKSFEYRTERSLVLHKLNLETTTIASIQSLSTNSAVQAGPAWRPYRNTVLDTFKIYTKAHGAKTTNLIINLDHDEWILDDGRKILADAGFENETEVSFFNRQAYENFKLNPEIRWDVMS